MHHGDGRHRLGPLGVLGVGLQVGVVEGGHGQRPLEARVTRRSRAVPDPEADQHQDADPEQQADEALAHRTDAAEPEAARVAGCWIDAVHVGGDVTRLGVGDVARAEAGHVGRPGADGLDDLGRGGQVQARGVGPAGQGVTGPGDGVAGGAVEGEQGVARLEVGAVEC